MTYEKAMAEVVKFENTDVITTSGCTGEAHKNDCNFNSSFCGITVMQVLASEQY